MFRVTVVCGSSSSSLMTGSTQGPLGGNCDNLQLADKLFFKEGRDVMWTSASNVESYPLIRVLVD